MKKYIYFSIGQHVFKWQGTLAQPARRYKIHQNKLTNVALIPDTNSSIANAVQHCPADHFLSSSEESS